MGGRAPFGGQRYALLRLINAGLADTGRFRARATGSGLRVKADTGRLFPFTGFWSSLGLGTLMVARGGASPECGDHRPATTEGHGLAGDAATLICLERTGTEVSKKLTSPLWTVSP